ncbi:CHAT domain-containing protein [Jiulongibacter sediminis]|uniref:CHAT domain-containing protein n=1 Tax=Jiulongibacter sediminis TaxID=1605367 RepID=A0A0P7BCE9_9BACT|nr:CHAT domain-containing protein [Jiulongibacter sediminis]KPM48247.1 hypothetical protein AFM12_06190 [Jiulongibacter sediminis]TBX24789.1 hypothetical protein TK44_06195 [Jiulongibacter sediminis]
MHHVLRTMAFWLLSVATVFGQTSGLLPSKLKEALRLFYFENPTAESDRKALLLFNELSKATVKSPEEAAVVALSTQKAGVLYQTSGHEKEAVQAFQKSLQLASNYHLEDSIGFHSALYLGGLYHSLFEYDSAYHYLRQSEHQYFKNNSLTQVGRLFNVLGVLYFETGDFRQSIPYFQKSIELRQESGEDDYVLRNNLAFAFHELGESDRALKIYLTLIKEYPDQEELLLNAAVVYTDKGQTKKAEELLSKIKRPYVDEVLVHKAKGELELKKGAFDRANTFFDLALKERGETKGTLIGGLWLNSGEASFEKKDYTKALNSFQNALIALSPEFDNTNVYSNPEVFTDGYTSDLLFEALAFKAETLIQLNASKASEKVKKAAIEAYEKALVSSMVLTKKYRNEASRIDFIKKLDGHYRHFTEFLIRQKQYEKAFQISDHGKATVLAMSISEGEVRKQVPENLLNQEKMLLLRESALLRQQQAGYGEKEDELKEVRLKLSQLKRSIDEQVGHSLSKSRMMDIETIQDRLHRKELLLSYFEGSETSGFFVVSSKDFEFVSLKDGLSEKNQIVTLKKKLRSMEKLNKQDKENLAVLYQFLFKDIEKQLISKNKIIFSSDGVLNGFPLEVLLDKRGLYLGQQYAVAYLLNSFFLQSEKNQNRERLAMAPFTAPLTAYPTWHLPASGEEIENTSAHIFRNEEALKKTFLDHAGGYGLIHLATHAKAHETDANHSYIQFYPADTMTSENRLYLHELYPGSFPGSLVFLSACESFGSEEIKGEGIRGLSYGFLRAGASGVISSLWSAEDFSTAEISRLYYEYLGEGFDAAAALQKARADFLNNPDFAQFHEPQYWAHLVFTGYQPHEESSVNLRLLGLALFVLFALAVAYS